MKKATRGQLRRHNRELVLQAVYSEIALNRAALAQVTGLTKPAISNLVSELIDEGLLVEGGLGSSTDSGGKRPRLLRFVPDARQVIGLALKPQNVRGVLTNLDGHLIATHEAELPALDPDTALDVMVEVANGLRAQLSAPLLCVGVGLPAVVDDAQSTVRFAPQWDWHDLPLGAALSERLDVPAHVYNNKELAAVAQIAGGDVAPDADLVTLLVNDSIGVGLVLGQKAHNSGSEIGHLMVDQVPLEQRLGWHAVAARARELAQQHGTPALQRPDLSYLVIRHAAANGDPAALALRDELIEYLALSFAWIVALLQPDHVSLAGAIADLGDDFLARIVDRMHDMVLPLGEMQFTLTNMANLVARGAAAQAVHRELGLL